MRFKEFLEKVKHTNLAVAMNEYTICFGLDTNISGNVVSIDEEFCRILNSLGAAIIGYTGKLVKIVTDDGSIYSIECKESSNGYDKNFQDEILIDFGTIKEMSRKSNMYVITNKTKNREFAPTIAKTREEAINQMRRNMAIQIKRYGKQKDENISFEGMSADEIIEWGENNIFAFIASEDNSELSIPIQTEYDYCEDEWQKMKIHEVKISYEQIKWLKAVYNENSSSEMRFYLNPDEYKPGDVAYCYSNKTTKTLLIQEIVSEKYNKEQYKEIIKKGDSIEDILSTGELFFNADTSADFVSNEGRIFVWFKDISLEYKGDLFKIL